MLHSKPGRLKPVLLPMRSPNRTRIVLGCCLALLGSWRVAPAEKQPPAKKIDLNIANLKELQQLPGVGAVTAQRILDMRQKAGRFKRVEDLLAIRGISEKRLDAIRPYVTLGSAPSPAPAKKSSPPKKNSS